MAAVQEQIEENSLDEALQSRYRVWKKNTPFLYDYVSTYSLLWPSLSVSFFPDLERENKQNPLEPTKKTDHEVLMQRLLLGTFTLGQSIDSISILQLPYYENLNKNLTIDTLSYNPDKLEFELPKVPKKKLNVLQKIINHGDVNKLRYMPQNPDVIASGNNFGNLVIYDRTKHSSYTTSDISNPDLKLGTTNLDNNQDIYAIDWNKQRQGVIVSGKMNGVIDLYDIKSQFTDKDNNHLNPLKTITNKSGVNDIEWIINHDSLFNLVDEDGHYKLIDTRVNDTSIAIDRKISDNAVNTISVNQQDSKFLSTGDSAGNIQIWDIRNLKSSNDAVFTLPKVHDDSITQVKWHPKFHNILGSSSTDKTVKLFDLDKSTKQEDPLMFIHGGHMLGVNDFDWSLHDNWMVASVADDNSLHVWKPSNEIVKQYQ